MRKISLILIASLFIASVSLADTRITFVSGSVNAFHKGQWVEAKSGMSLDAKDKVKTVSGSKAALVVDEQTRIWVSQNSEMEVSESSGGGNVFGLLLGKIRAKVKLLAGRKFSVKTPVAVASVRGTDFDIDSEGKLNVFGGMVGYSGADGQGKDVGEGQTSQVGDDGKPTEPRDMTPEEKQNAENEWQGFGDIGDQGKGDQEDKKAEKEAFNKEMERLRHELLVIVEQIKNDLAQTRELTNEIKESDFSTGRTLRDVHGNVVRVEQHVLRPDNHTLEFLNLTKRAEYSYSDRQKWGFTVPAGSRLDMVSVKMKMNMSLPDQITDWPSYISSKGDDMHPDSVNVKMSNMKDEMEFTGEWRLKGQPDEKGNALEDDRLVFDSYINGWKVDETYDAELDPTAVYKEGQDYPKEGEEPEELFFWSISPQLKITKDGMPDKYVRLFTEGYVINNDGNVLRMRDFTSTSEDPFTVFKKVAGEQIIFCREINGTDFFVKGNLDIVTTPDMMIAVVQKLGTQIGELSKSSSDD